jgi:hypothetical protein
MLCLQTGGPAQQASHAANKTPRGERVVSDGASAPGAGGDVEDFKDVLSKVLSPSVLHNIYQLALKKREQLRKMGGSGKRRNQPEDAEDDALDSILPVGVEYLKRPTMAGRGAGGGGA